MGGIGIWRNAPFFKMSEIEIDSRKIEELKPEIFRSNFPALFFIVNLLSWFVSWITINLPVDKFPSVCKVSLRCPLIVFFFFRPQDQRLQALWTVISRLPKPNYNNFRQVSRCFNLGHIMFTKNPLTFLEFVMWDK